MKLPAAARKLKAEEIPLALLPLLSQVEKKERTKVHFLHSIFFGVCKMIW
jgi:hypothetical protein